MTHPSNSQIMALAQAMEEDLAAAPEVALAAIAGPSPRPGGCSPPGSRSAPSPGGRTPGDGPEGPGTHALRGWPEAEHLPIEDPEGTFLLQVAAEMSAAQDTLDAAGIALTVCQAAAQGLIPRTFRAHSRSIVVELTDQPRPPGRVRQGRLGETRAKSR